MQLEESPEITSLVVKIASRCNINCDYCYVYQHADQSYKKMPRVLSEAHIKALAKQINTYLIDAQLESMRICLHGGEPLIAGVAKLEAFFKTMLSELREDKRMDFVVQTNGTLLTKGFLDLFERYKVGVSVSLDGPQSANDKHRLDFQGKSTFHKVEAAIALLKEQYPHLFLGVLSVIDPTNDPVEIIDYFAAMDVQYYDLLLPDSNHFVLPPLKKMQPSIYIDWLKRAITHWSLHHSKMNLRTFVDLFQGVSGNATQSEFFGNGVINYLVIETDGSYHYSDLLKIAYEGASKTGLNVETSSIKSVITSPVIEMFQKKMKEGYRCKACQNCPEYAICGSGLISHRYGPNGFDHPTVYCQEMLAMIAQGRHLMLLKKVKTAIKNPATMVDFFLSEHAIYLLCEMTKKAIPSKKVLGSSYKILIDAFPHLAQEMAFIYDDNSLDEQFDDAELLFQDFLQKKLKLLHLYDPLCKNDETVKEISEFYRQCYLYRLLQIHMMDGICNTYNRMVAMEEDLVRFVQSFNQENLFEIGRELVKALIDEFFTEQMYAESTQGVC